MPPGPSCPSLEEFGKYEAGLQSEEAAAAILGHVAECPDCAGLLADLCSEGSHRASSNGSADLGATMALPSSTRKWKRKLLGRIAQELDQNVKQPGIGRWWPAAAAACVVGIAGGVWWTSFRNTPEAALSLIAQAYTEQRPFELRIPGAAHSPLRVTRGALDSPGVSLLDARRRIAERLQQQPASTLWLRAKARADLLQWNYAATIEALRRAQETEPDNPDILGDLGIAYLQRAEMESRPQDVAQAIEYVGKAADVTPSEPAYRFNLALAYERQPAPRQALDEWNELLRREPKGAWAEEAREHASRLQKMIDNQVNRGELPLTSEDAITAFGSVGFQSTKSMDIGAAAADLAQIHGDRWMQDLLEANQTTRSETALGLLASALQAFRAGESSQGDSNSRQALKAFRAAGNVPGTVYAAFEQAYALQRLSRPMECVEAARQELSTAQVRRYRWLEAQLRLTLGTCLASLSRYDEAYKSTVAAQEIAESSKYTVLELRALGFRASFLRDVGSYREAVKLDWEGLVRFWGANDQLLRGYQFYYDMALATSGLQHPRAAASLMNEAVHLAALLPDRYVEAMVRALYGGILIEDHSNAAASEQFDQSSKIFAGLPESPSSRFYKSYAEISTARLEGQRNQVEKGLERLGHMESMLGTVQSADVEAQLWSVKSELLALAGRDRESEEVLGRLLALGSSARMAAPGGSDRAMLAREVSRAVNALADRHLQRGEAERAWQVWKEYNPSFRTLPTSQQSARLIYANLPSGPVVWISDSRGIRAQRLSLAGKTLQQLAENFRRALADPREPMERIRDLGRSLYIYLIDPIRDQVEPATALYIAADGPFAEIPFGALISRDGRWLSDRYRIVYSPPFGGAEQPTPAGLRKDLPLVAAGYGDASQVLQAMLPSLPGIEGDLQAAAGALPNQTVLQGPEATLENIQRALAKAGVFHFSGHAIMTAGDAALVLAPRASGDQDRLLWASQIPKRMIRSCRLVMLAACSTGRAAGEDNDPSSVMARQFIMAGVPEVIASRWDVDSRATSALVKMFYMKVAQGASSEEALIASVRELREQPAFAHPYFWAAFDLFRS